MNCMECGKDAYRRESDIFQFILHPFDIPRMVVIGAWFYHTDNTTCYWVKK